jgi:hypothetical protein
MSEYQPEIMMLLVKRKTGTLYQIIAIEEDRVRLEPYWKGRNSRTTWKTRTHLCADYRMADKGCRPCEFST